jgi:hypothetical protein
MNSAGVANIAAIFIFGGIAIIMAIIYVVGLLTT